MYSNGENLPHQIGKYRILSVLGEGGMGIVYKAIDPNIEQQVALKVIRPEILQQDRSNTMLKRFRNEVLACRRLKHENIVSTFDYQEQDNYCYIVMELVDGTLLSDHLKQDIEFDQNQIITLISQLLSALQYAHDKGVIHRDIKPDNISIKADGSIQMMDFGIAKLDTSNVTMIGSFLGSPGYMSPEQCQEQEADARSDIFSVGAVLYQLLTGKKPFAADTMAIVLHKTLKENPVKPSEINPSLNPAFDKIVAKALAKQPKKRYQTAAEFKAALDHIVQSTDSSHGKPSLPVKPVLIGTFSLLVLALSLAIYKKLAEPEQTQPAQITHDVKPTLQVAPLADLKQLLASFPCNTLTVQQNNEFLLIQGTVLPEDIDAANQRIQTLLGNSPHETQITGLKRPYCHVIGLLAPYYQNNLEYSPPIKISPYRHSNRYVAGEIIQFEVTTPDFPAFLYADFYAADGAMFHLFPTSLNELKAVGAHQQFILGEGHLSFEVSPPFGTDLVTLIASPTPLYTSIQNDSDPLENYLALLASGFRQVNQKQILADYLFISTAAEES